MCADTTTALLQAADINVNYGKFQAINNLSLTLNAGDTLGLLGLNGAGKSTLLRVLAGTSAPGSGAVSINGHDLSKQPLAAKQNIGYAPDKPPVYPEFTVREFLTFAARLRRVAKKKLKTSIDTAIEKCALQQVTDRVIGNLSHGYQQRINLAQALVHEPRLLILDEPANGLDPAQLLEMRSLVQQIQSDQATIFSSHLLGEVQQVCNRVMVINDGQKLLDIPLLELSDNSKTTYELILQGKANQQDLQNLPGVLRICTVDEKHWLVTTNADNSAATVDQIGEVLIERGLRLLEVNPVRNHLEKLFSQLKLNSGNQPVAIGGAS